MADYTLSTPHRGVYEIPVPANEIVTVGFESKTIWDRSVRVMVHSGSAPVYVRTGETVEARDPFAEIVPGLSYMDIGLRGNKVIAITSTQAATVSVVRS